MKRILSTSLAASAASGAALLLAAAPASATTVAPPQHVIKTLSSAFVAPLQFAIDGGKTYVADSATSTLNLIGDKTPLAVGPDPSKGGDLAGVGVDPRTHAIAYTTSNGDHSMTALTILQSGRKPVVANLAAFEKAHNPDAVNHYGTSSRNACVDNGLKKAGAPVSYTGQLDSHPYAVAALGDGAWAVADAGGNDLLRVSSTGQVSLISVLPPQPVKITAAVASANKLPKCVVGITYAFEPVPTDVEVGPGGALFVSTLPGGVDDIDGSNPGSVYRIADDGQSTKVATGFVAATNLAINPYGNIFVAQLGTGTIAEVVSGKPQVITNLPGVVGVEFANGHLYASTAPAVNGGKSPGKIVELSH